MSDLDLIKCLGYKKTSSFVLDGEHYVGDIDVLYSEYTLENPSIKFRVWLINKGFRVSFISY